jgi:hypothetical protein
MQLRRLPRVAKNLAIDLYLGGSIAGHETTRFGHLGAHDIGAADYDDLRRIFSLGAIRDGETLVDLGSGKGRVLNWWTLKYRQRNTIVGVEIDPYLAERSRSRLARYPSVRVITGHVLDVLPAVGGDLFFMFNPFDESVMRGVELAIRDRPAQVVYYHPKHLDVWRNGYWNIDLSRDSRLTYPLARLTPRLVSP